MEKYNLIILTAVIIYIWNHSGFIFDLSKAVYKWLNPNKIYMGQPLQKPFGCAQCLVFWVTTIYSIAILSIPLIESLGVGVMFSLIAIVIDKIYIIFLRAINKIN